MSGDVVMVTGGAGFVGSHLVELLLADGHEVHVFDLAPLASAHGLSAVANHPGLRYVQGDLRDRDALQRFYRPEASTLYHLASIVGVRYYMEDPLALIDIVVGGTRALLELARRHGTRVLLTSTSEVYGRNPAVPWSEDDDRVLGPPSIDRWSYSSSKAVCEHMLFAVHRKDGLPMSIVRLFNAYGPRQNPIYVVSQSVYRALRGEAPYLYDGGRQTRCFTYISDIVLGIRAAGRDPRAVGEIVNLGRPVESSIREVVELIIGEVGGDLTWTDFDTHREYGAVYEDIPRRVPDVGKAARLLDWTAEISIEEGVTHARLVPIEPLVARRPRVTCVWSGC